MRYHRSCIIERRKIRRKYCFVSFLNGAYRCDSGTYRCKTDVCACTFFCATFLDEPQPSPTVNLSYNLHQSTCNHEKTTQGNCTLYEKRFPFAPRTNTTFLHEIVSQGCATRSPALNSIKSGQYLFVRL